MINPKTDTGTIEGNWLELRARIKSRWSKFNDEQLEGVKSDINGLADQIQKVYGIAKEHADRQYDDFKKTVQSLIAPERVPVKSVLPSAGVTAAEQPSPSPVPQSKMTVAEPMPLKAVHSA